MPKQAIAMFVFLWVALASTAYAKTDTCVSCHKGLDDKTLSAPVAGMALDVHAKYGLSCADCHGGDPTAADMEASMDPKRGYVGAPDRRQIPNFCGKCHQNAVYMRKFDPSIRVDQLDLYWTSVHGQKLRAGDDKVATCVDCHSHHGILPPSDARSPVYRANIPATCGRCHSNAKYMAGYGIPTDQYAKYKKSVHGRALLERGERGAPACNDCHGNHGAAPPGVASVANVCGQCHPVNAELFSKSPHAAPFAEEGMATCETCHGSHEIMAPSEAMLGGGKGSVCVQCHDTDSKGYVTAVAIKDALDGLRNRHDEADSLLSRAERAGMQVQDARFQLNQVQNDLTKARASVHGFTLSRVEDVVTPGDSLADATIQQGHRALAEIQFRRKGLGFSLIAIAIVGMALFFKIREVDRRRGLK